MGEEKPKYWYSDGHVKDNSHYVILKRTEKLLPVFNLSIVKPEAFVYGVIYEFEDECDQIYLKEVRNAIDYSVFCKKKESNDYEDDDEDEGNALVTLYILARTDKDVIISLESPRKYLKRVVTWDNEKKDALEYEYEDLDIKDIL